MQVVLLSPATVTFKWYVSYLKKDVRGVMKQHDQSANANVVGTVGETQQEDGGQMVNHLFFKILAKQTCVESLVSTTK